LIIFYFLESENDIFYEMQEYLKKEKEKSKNILASIISNLVVQHNLTLAS